MVHVYPKFFEEMIIYVYIQNDEIYIFTHESHAKHIISHYAHYHLQKQSEIVK